VRLGSDQVAGFRFVLKWQPLWTRQLSSLENSGEKSGRVMKIVQKVTNSIALNSRVSATPWNLRQLNCEAFPGHGATPLEDRTPGRTVRTSLVSGSVFLVVIGGGKILGFRTLEMF